VETSAHLENLIESSLSMERDRGGSLLRGSTDPPGDSHHGSYGFAKTKKKEKGYKSVGLVSSEDDDDASMMINSGPSSQRLFQMCIRHFPCYSRCFSIHL
jgi:hypothetical protein